MNKKNTALLCLSALLLTGCGTVNTTIPEKDEVLMTIGDQTVTAGQEYQLIKRVNGPVLLIQGVQRDIYAKEVGDGEEIQKKVDEMYEQFASNNENFEEQLVNYGYADKQDYIDNVVLPTVQATELFRVYLNENKTEIEAQYHPVLASIIACNSEDNAKKAQEAIKNGTSPVDAANEYAMEGASYKGEEQIISTLVTDLPDRLTNTLYETEKDGVLDEIFENDTTTENKVYYVVDLISSDYDANLDKIVEAFESDQDLNKACITFYLKKYDFEIHDQYMFDYFKATNPQYLVTRPDLAESESASK